MSEGGGFGKTERTIDSILLDLVQDVGIVQAQNASILSEQAEARESRRLMHKKLEDMKDDLTELTQKVKVIEDTTVPTVRRHEAAWQQAQGMWIVIALGWSAAMVAVGWLAQHYWGGGATPPHR